MIIECVEKCGSNRNAADAVWVPNGDQLHYPNVSTCVTVTLIFQNGLLGGHASQYTLGSKYQPPQNLQDVIKRMISLIPDKSTLITSHFGDPREKPPVNVSPQH